MILILNSSLYSAEEMPALSNKDLDGLYYVSPNNSLIEYLVLSDDGKPIPQKPDDPDAPTDSGLYYKEIRFQIQSFKLKKAVVSFETAVIGNIKFRFKGKVQSRIEPEFDVPLISLHGTIEMIDKRKILQRQNIIFEKGVIY